ncbi:type II toxin-antitoxin system VapC family toxin [Caenispirillum bisanense]|uniref:Ribonuclease VapC n=1 Tax=Caenispirillum bisanense TaxID=414052 RepID=A0A286GY12_9PROT|nr:type II toxin-antitoxin system VapC family toxin [Caenispirillum bisanense]SOE00420.1 PIN domain nuclease, a component of toxin-antitoxin system (PIN domain) [Caenispirillum bisanense]
MSDVVLDASALLALLDREPGYEAVAAVMPGALLSTVNLSEVLGKLVDRGVPVAVAARVAEAVGATVVDLDTETAVEAAALRQATRGAGLSLGDRACLALARQRGLPALTTDAAWERVASAVGVDVRNIRPRP